jgi:hypothetical protein
LWRKGYGWLSWFIYINKWIGWSYENLPYLYRRLEVRVVEPGMGAQMKPRLEIAIFVRIVGVRVGALGKGWQKKPRLDPKKPNVIINS